MASEAIAKRKIARGGWLKRWRANLDKRVKPPRRLKFTREGKYFTGMTILIGFGAINTGNNLLYLLLGMMLALIILSGVLSENVLQRLRVYRRLPERIFANQPALVEVRMANDKARSSSFSIQIQDRIEGIDEEKRPAVYFLRVPPGQEATSQYRFAFPRRGRWKIEGTEVATRFPFDLFRKSRDFDDPLEVLVFPQPLDPPPLYGVASRPQGDVRRHKVGHGGDFHGLRDWRQGDDARDVHWKITAKRGVMIVREFEEEEARTLTLCFHNRWQLEEGDDVAQDAYRDKLEEAVGVCAGLAQRLLARGYAVALTTLDARVSAGTGAAQFDRVLRTLALVRFHGDPDFLQDPDAAQEAGLSDKPRFELNHQDHCVVIGQGPLPGLHAGHLIEEVSL